MSRDGLGLVAPASSARVVKRAGERGQIFALTGFVLVGICAVVAVAADLGYFFEYRRRMQTGVDGAAMAGADQLRRGGTDAEIRTAAWAGSAADGFPHGVGGTVITVNHPPASGYYAGKNGYVEAIISQRRPTIFMGILGFQSTNVSTRAVAGVKDSPNCIYALNPTASHAFNTSGGAAINASCGIVVDSADSAAMSSSGGSTVVNASKITVSGNTSGCCFSPTPKTNVPPEPDPLATTAAPTFSGCTYTNFKVASSVATLFQGVYCGGIDISGGSVVAFSPGLYVLNGGGLSVSGGSTLSGTGVTFYNTASGHYSYKPISISGGTTGLLSAPTSGPMEGMLFFQDRSISSNATNAISGGSTLGLEGVLYFPTTSLDFSGGSSGTVSYTIIVASTINFSGQSTLNASYGSLEDGNPIKQVALAE